MTAIQSTESFDVCIVGSGAGGGMAAKILTDGGANVVMLEAGDTWDVNDQGDMLMWNYMSPRRGAGTTKRPFGEFDACDGGWDIPGEPYTTAGNTDFRWFRARMLGGRTNHWGRISLRFGPDDFRGRSRDGYGDDWPISYDDIAPYYDRLDRMIGIFGSEENIPNAPAGIYQPPPAPRCYERLFQQSGEQMGLPVIPSRLSILTEPLNGRAACHYCAQCNRGCSTHSNFSSPPVLIDPALSTGRLTLLTNAMVREVTTDAEGRATGVSYVDTRTHTEQQVRADIVILAASACESARLLLNSTSNRHPNGLANSSGVVGKYLMDSTGTNVTGLLPQLMNDPDHNCDGVGGMHVYIPWWLHEEHDRLNFPRGYHFEIYGGRGMPGYGIMSNIHTYNDAFMGPDERPNGGGGYGPQLKEDYRRLFGAVVGMAGRGEMIAREENYCEIDPQTVDQYGIPVLRFNVNWSDAELQQVRHMQETGRELIETMGGMLLGDMPTEEQDYGITMPGEIIHDAGTTRMGNDPNTSVLNSYCQAHDVDNLFVTDAGPLVSMPHKNPTWTIMALAMRASDYIIEQRRQGAL